MPVITLAQWKEAVGRISMFKQTNALREVTTRFEVFTERKTQTTLENLASAATTWWNTAPVSEQTTLGTARANLLDTIAADRQANNAIVTTAARITSIGWTLGAADPSLDTTLEPEVPNTDPTWVPAFTPAQIQILNETFARSKRSVELARDAMVTLSAQSGFGSSPSTEEAAYLSFFGAFDKSRLKDVRENYKTLYAAFTSSPIVIDARNRGAWGAVYGFTFPGRVTNGVTIYIGKAFFDRSKKSEALDRTTPLTGRLRGRTGPTLVKDKTYAKSSDNSVGVFIHEFSHACFAAVDAPQVYEVGSALDWYPGEPDRTPGDTYGSSSDPTRFQCSTEDMDQLLARKDPSVAIRNADNYCQFARRLLMHAEKI